MDDLTRNPSKLRRFFSNPIVGVTGSIASIVGVILAILFFVKGSKERDLQCFVHPVKSVVVRGGEASKLSVTGPKGEINGDVTAIQIAIWNAGQEPIRSEHMLKKLTVQTDQKVSILEARIRKQSRDVVGLELDTSAIDQGRIGIDWKILENADGGVVQLIIAGGTDVNLSVSGTVEGQKEIGLVEFSGKIRAPTDQYVSTVNQGRVLGWVYLGISLLTAILVLFLHWVRIRYQTKRELGWMDWATLIYSLVLIGIAIYRLSSGDPGPPFGF